jgi:hypothetical protein
MKSVPGLVALGLFSALAGQDPSDKLEEVRDRLKSSIPSEPQSVCTQTMERSYSSLRGLWTRPSCEQLSSTGVVENKRRWQLDYTDRVRVDVSVTRGREIYSWTGPDAFSQSVEAVVQTGSFGTGEFSAFLSGLFGIPSVRFRILSESAEALEFGFRVPVEANPYFVGGGREWLPTGFNGSLLIDPGSLELKQLRVTTSELPRETSLCEVTTVSEYAGTNSLGLLLPRVSRTIEITRNGKKAERITTFSGCRQGSAVPRRADDSLQFLPEGIVFEVEFTAPIDTVSAAAGDVISARLTRPILGPKILAPVGTKVTGRIIRLEHRLNPPGFILAVALDRLQTGNAVFRVHSINTKPEALSFPTTNPAFVIPAESRSTWRTTGER